MPRISHLCTMMEKTSTGSIAMVPPCDPALLLIESNFRTRDHMAAFR